MTHPLDFDALRASYTDGLHNCLTIAKRVPIPDTPSQTPLWVPLVSFSPNRHRFWNTNAGCNTPKGTITPIPCSLNLSGFVEA